MGEGGGGVQKKRLTLVDLEFKVPDWQDYVIIFIFIPTNRKAAEHTDKKEEEKFFLTYKEIQRDRVQSHT